MASTLELPRHTRPAGTPEPHGPEQGVIEEARRRQRRRRLLLYTALVTTALAGVLVWALSEGTSKATPGHGGAPPRPSGSHAAAAPAFAVRLIPELSRVGQAGWCAVPEVDGRAEGEACGGVALASVPFVSVQGWSVGGSHHWTTVAVTLPQVASVLVEDHTRVATQPLPGLPYGFRAARIVTPSAEPIRLGRGAPPGPRSVVPLDAAGQPITSATQRTTPLQGTVSRWRYPAPEAQGSCRLTVSGIPGLVARGGAALRDVRPYPGDVAGHAFLPCVSTVYSLQGVPIRAMVVLDAAEPRTPASALPDFSPLPRAPGVLANGGLAARREGNAWLVVGQGRGLAERVELLRHLRAELRL